jgi:threonine-phosphate decarboxylase
MSKIFKMPGLRVGFLKGPPPVIRRLLPYRLPWSVNTLAQAAAAYVLAQKELSERYVRETRAYVEAEAAAFRQRMNGHKGLSAFFGTAGFVLVKLPFPLTAAAVCEALGKEKILLRNCANFEGLSERFIRVSLKGREENRRVAERLVSLGP